MAFLEYIEREDEDFSKEKSFTFFSQYGVYKRWVEKNDYYSNLISIHFNKFISINYYLEI